MLAYDTTFGRVCGSLPLSMILTPQQLMSPAIRCDQATEPPIQGLTRGNRENLHIVYMNTYREMGGISLNR